MNFGLEDIKNNTILGTPVNELSSKAEELKRSINSNKNGSSVKVKEK